MKFACKHTHTHTHTHYLDRCRPRKLVPSDPRPLQGTLPVEEEEEEEEEEEVVVVVEGEFFNDCL